MKTGLTPHCYISTGTENTEPITIVNASTQRIIIIIYCSPGATDDLTLIILGHLIFV